MLLIVTDVQIKRGNFYLFWKENARIDEIAINMMTIVIQNNKFVCVGLNYYQYAFDNILINTILKKNQEFNWQF